jgi:hypothetical protein
MAAGLRDALLDLERQARTTHKGSSLLGPVNTFAVLNLLQKFGRRDNGTVSYRRR